MKEAFERLDKTGDGVVAVDDILQAYNFDHHPGVQSGSITPDMAAREMLQVFESGSDTKDGIVTWPEFLDYYRVKVLCECLHSLINSWTGIECGHRQ